MDSSNLPGSSPEQLIVNQVIAQYDAPAYVRRARKVEAALQVVHEHCHKQREEWLTMVRLHLGRLRMMAGEWSTLRPLVASETQLTQLAQLHETLQPVLRLAVPVSASPRRLRAAISHLNESIARFNARWREFLTRVDCRPVNELREGYNRYYLLEKECALRSGRLARAGFAPLPPLDVPELLNRFPYLHEVMLAE